MFDKFKLEYEMKSKGVTVDQLCAELKINKSTFYRKMKGTSEFTRSEIQDITNYLHLDTPVGIFLPSECR